MKNVLLLIHDDPGQEARFQVALDVTRAIDGHLTCVDVTPIQPLLGDGFLANSNFAVAVLEGERAREDNNSSRVQHRLGVEDVNWSWADAIGDAELCLLDHAELADVIIISGDISFFLFPDKQHVAANLIRHSNKLILTVPDRQVRLDLTGGALIAWDGSSGAANALSATVPLLKLASEVTLLEIDGGSIGEPAEEAAAYLSRHGVHPNIDRREAGGAAAIILARACSDQFAYLVMGGYGHHPIGEALLGGVSRELLAKSPIPLFVKR